MVKISIQENQPALSVESLSAVFQNTGMSQEESDYYAQQTAQGSAFEIEAPDSDLVDRMIHSLTELGVELTIERDSLQ